MNKKIIAEGLKEYPQDQVEKYISYLYSLETATKKGGSQKNPWMKHRKDADLISFFKNVAADGLVFDGVDITLQSTGVSYSYQSYKTKMLIAYPESIIDVNLVYRGDTFSFSKNSGNVNYTHTIEHPFIHKDEEIQGAYCVVKNKRGQFLTTMSRQEIDKHRRVAKTDYIWKAWFPEMCMKTVIKKACKQHFKDTYQNIETIDNENYDLEQLNETITEKQITIIKELIKSTESDKSKFLKWLDADKIETIPVHSFNKAVSALKAKASK